MIYITKGAVNTICLTLTESTTISQPVYLFKFTWQTDPTDVLPVYWIGSDISNYPYRYNLFELDEGTDETFRIGQYLYEVYEDVQGSTPVDETGLTKVEEGIMVVYGVASTIYD